MPTQTPAVKKPTTLNWRDVAKKDRCLEKRIAAAGPPMCGRKTRAAFGAVCQRREVDRICLTRSEHIQVLSTPRGYKWTGKRGLRYIERRCKNMPPKLRRRWDSNPDQHVEDISQAWKLFVPHFLLRAEDSLTPATKITLTKILVSKVNFTHPKWSNRRNTQAELCRFLQDLNPDCSSSQSKRDSIRALSSLIFCYFVQVLCSDQIMKKNNLINMILNTLNQASQKPVLDSTDNLSKEVKMFIANMLSPWLNSSITNICQNNGDSKKKSYKTNNLPQTVAPKKNKRNKISKLTKSKKDELTKLKTDNKLTKSKKKEPTKSKKDEPTKPKTDNKLTKSKNKEPTKSKNIEPIKPKTDGKLSKSKKSRSNKSKNNEPIKPKTDGKLSKSKKSSSNNSKEDGSTKLKTDDSIKSKNNELTKSKIGDPSQEDLTKIHEYDEIHDKIEHLVDKKSVETILNDNDLKNSKSIIHEDSKILEPPNNVDSKSNTQITESKKEMSRSVMDESFEKITKISELASLDKIDRLVDNESVETKMTEKSNEKIVEIPSETSQSVSDKLTKQASKVDTDDEKVVNETPSEEINIEENEQYKSISRTCSSLVSRENDLETTEPISCEVDRSSDEVKNCFQLFADKISNMTKAEQRNEIATDSKKCVKKTGVIYEINRRDGSGYSLRKTMLPLCEISETADPTEKSKTAVKKIETKGSWKFNYDKDICERHIRR